MIDRRPPPHLIAPAASPLEAAAIAAALERFMRETAAGGLDPQGGLDPAGGSDPWARMAMLEGVGREDEWPSTWGHPHPWA